MKLVLFDINKKKCKRNLISEKKIKTFVVFDFVSMPIFSFIFPFFKFRNGEEAMYRISFCCFNDWGDKFFQKRKS